MKNVEFYAECRILLTLTGRLEPVKVVVSENRGSFSAQMGRIKLNVMVFCHATNSSESLLLADA